MSKVRLKVEHAISSIKPSRTVKEILRNTKTAFLIWCWWLLVDHIIFKLIIERNLWNHGL